MADEYRARMKWAAGMRNLDIWYAHIEVEAHSKSRIRSTGAP
jgi:hypothetical protein